MKRPAPLLAAAALLLTAALPLRADDPPALSLTVAPDGSWETAWQGVNGITYFMQWSPDLVHWQYFPMMKVDVGPHTYGGPANVTEKYFIRLRSTDQATLDPAGDSFDTDTLSNWDEVTEYATDPFNADTDGDGMPDDFEVAHQLDPNTPDAALDLDHDGLANLAEMGHGTDPAAPDTDHDGVSDWDELVTNATDPLQALDLDTDGITDDLEKHLAKQFLAFHPAPEYWGAFHAGLVAGNLDPTHAYTADGSIASVVPTLVAMAAMPPVPYGVFIEPQYRENSLVGVVEPAPPGEPPHVQGTYWHSMLDGETGTVALTSAGDFVPSYLSGLIEKLPWVHVLGAATPVFQYQSCEWLVGEGESLFSTDEQGLGGVSSGGYIYQRRSRLAAGRVDHEPEAHLFLKVTTREALDDPVSSPLVIAAETVVLELPADRLTGDWLDLAAPIADGHQTVVKLVPVNVTLDVNGSGYALGTYLPGYEGGVAKLHTGDSFKSNSYSGPQPLILVIPGIDPAIADAATFRILNPTSYEGYCGNALIATGTTPADDAKNREDDFSFAADGDDRETEATVANGAIRAPIFCKDYGAWCEVEVILRKGTAVLGPPFTITLPLDRNHDRLADGWQYAENLKWNAQFNPATPRPAGADGRALVNPDLDDEEIDPDGRNGDGGRDLPAMATTGDGLRICEEYRGFILDGGPGITTPGQHKRLSIARKEMLVECSAEQNLSLAGQNPALQTFALLEAMKDVSEFYRDPAKGASIDLYWVEDEIIQNQNFIFYQGNAFPVKDAREWFGTCEYNRKENGSNITIGGSGVPAHDRAWRSFAQDAHDKFYNGDPPIGKIPKLQQDNRNPSLERFLKLLLPSRLGYVEGGVRLVNGVEEIDPNALRYLNDGFDHAAGEPSGARISVAALADEGMGNYWATFHRHLTQDEFNRLVRRAISHELGHLIHQNHYMVPHGDSIMDDLLLVLPDTTVRGLSTSIWHAVEVGEIHLPGQSAGPLTP